MSGPALILGGAECVFNDYQKATTLFAQAGVPPIIFVCNDMIAVFTGPIDHAVTLEPDKLERLVQGSGDWLGERERRGFAPPGCTWSHRAAAGVDRVAREWLTEGGRSGSSGLFAIKIARDLGHRKILLCGVPMRAEAKHFLRKKIWRAAFAHAHAWRAHYAEIAPYVRSFGGYTAELCGVPTLDFLRGE